MQSLVSTLVASAALFGILAGCAQPPGKSSNDALTSALAPYGFAPYVPPRSNNGAGWVFHIEEVYGGLKAQTTVCENIYPELAIRPGSLTMPNSTSGGTRDIGFSISLLEKLVGDKAKAEAALTNANVNQIELIWGPVGSEELPPERRFKKGGGKYRVNGSCAANLRKLKASNELNGVYVVQEAAYVDNFLLRTTANSKSAGQATVSLRELFDVKTTGSVTGDTKEEVKIKERRYIGFKGVKLTRFVDIEELSGESADIAAEEVPGEEMRRLLDVR